MLNGVIYAYLISFAVIGVVGAIIQYKFFYESEEDKKNKEEDNTKEHGDASQNLISKN